MPTSHFEDDKVREKGVRASFGRELSLFLADKLNVVLSVAGRSSSWADSGHMVLISDFF